MRWSICATRAEIIWSASRPNVIDPSSTWATNSLTRFLPRSRAEGSANRPCSTIWSRRLDSVACSTTAAVVLFCDSGIRFLLLAHFGLQLVQFVALADSFQQRFIQLLVSLQRSLQIVQASSQIEQFLHRLDLARDLLGLEIFQAPELQVDAKLAGSGVFAEFVLDRETQVRLHAVENGIKIVGCHFDETPFLQLR